MSLIQDLRFFRHEKKRLALENGVGLSWVSVLRWLQNWWSKLPRGGSNPVTDKSPWLNFKALKRLNQIVRPDMKVFEYGCGGSTLYFGSRVAKLVSVEHDPKWLAQIQEQMESQETCEWESYLREPVLMNPPWPTNPSDLNSYISGGHEYQGLSFSDYVTVIDDYPEEYFDLILIDGRARPSCFKHAQSRLKPYGYLVVDNIDIPYYSTILQFIRAYEWPGSIYYGPGPYSPRFWGTGVWQKVLSTTPKSNPYRFATSWDYQKAIVEPHLTQDSVVLDIGAGNFAAPRANVIADFYPDNQFHRSGQILEDRPLVVCSVERLPFLEKAFDFVICSHVLEHVDRPTQAMGELSRIAASGYAETPAYGKDALVGSGFMHQWQVVEFEGIMHFFEYSERQKEAHTTSPFMSDWMRPDYHPWQPFFWERHDIFNAQCLWHEPPIVIEHRRPNSTLNSLPEWKPVPESQLMTWRPLLTPDEISLLEKRLATPDGKRPMKYVDNAFVSEDGLIRYPVRGKRIYCEMNG
ncbi:MAG: methyltransferase domain-containing protein [Gemmataceae bacterium]